MSNSTAISHDPFPSTGTKRKADAMDSSEPAVSLPRNAKVIELLPEADVTLKVGQGEGALDIKASSHVLSLASKVFKVMLNSQFIEGTTKIIELKDEDPQLILDFCHIIHHQHDSIKDMNATRVKQLVVLADVRDCKKALTPWLFAELCDYLGWFASNLALSLVGPAFPSRLTGLEIEDFISFAALFGLNNLFWEATRAYIARARYPVLQSDQDRLVARLPSITSHGVCIYAFLNEVRLARVQKLLQNAIRDATIGFNKTSDYSHRLFTVKTFCAVSQAKYGTFMSWFVLEDIDPTALSSYAESWWTAMKSIRNIASEYPKSSDPDGGQTARIGEQNARPTAAITATVESRCVSENC